MHGLSLRPLTAASLLGALFLGPLPAHAELPPWAYGDQQRQAPVVVQLVVLSAARQGEEALVRGRVLRVERQPAAGSLKRGQTIEVRYSLPPQRAPGFVGPSPLRLPGVGEQLSAWLTPLPGRGGSFAPAAGGRSFGPSMEEVHEPR